MGVGPVELVVILLVAFLALGPGKSIDMARNAGKFIRDLRGTLNDVVSAADLSGEEEKKKPEQPRPSAPQPGDIEAPDFRERR